MSGIQSTWWGRGKGGGELNFPLPIPFTPGSCSPPHYNDAYIYSLQARNQDFALEGVGVQHLWREILSAKILKK